ncbi:hypothetical protein M413DRAFT_18125 [Hebeloma cylindrosporum]|uniref:RING-type domain-containing protein n=1 Tax=Hebeloma cylindrosporum TaxID=76867 RepID=A0A0C3C4H2_HEBCY|nr:hypothetical protein M413DRAFT_18125 [Hebeloma cylindrosporum h7]
MLTLSPGCACDVCAEEYGPHRLPHSIPCGHVLCASCCTTIVEKTSPRLTPACPFCREHFTSDSVRLIRMDFTTSGWSTPRRVPVIDTFNNFNPEVLQRKTAHLSSGGSKTRIEVRRLEDKVAKAAAKKCSVEEVAALYRELEDFLVNDKDEFSSSLFLSAALLKAILKNHESHSEASKSAKTAEANLKHKIEELEHTNSKLEAELRRQRSQYTQKSQEAQQLHTQVNQLRALATTLGVTPPEMPNVPSVSPTPSPSPAHISTSPTPYSASQSSYTSPVSRFNSMHSRSVSMSSRPTTPAASLSPTRSHTPALSSANPPPRLAPPRSHTPGPGQSSASAAAAALPRSHTPAPTPPRAHTPSLARSPTPAARPYTPAPPPVPPIPSLPIRYGTPAPPTMASYRAQTPAPLVPPKSRRLSQPSPPKMALRSTSEEKADLHERWLPPNHHGIPIVDDYEYSGSSGRKSTRPPSRASFGIPSQYQRA